MAKNKTKDQQFIDDLIEEVQNDFNRRRKERLALERQWQLNRNFLIGNQYCDLSSNGEIYSDEKEYVWQKRGVFNHIAPVIESRIAKLSRVNPKVCVRPRTSDDEDVANASVAEKLISGALSIADIEDVVKTAVNWSEVTGTGFYKVIWNNNGGSKIGKLGKEDVYEGDVRIFAVSPFEIFPDSLYAEKLSDCESLIHAKALSVEKIKEKYGVSLIGEKINVLGLETVNKAFSSKDKTVENSAVVIEKYEKPSSEFPEGRLIVVSQDKLLYYGELPYINDADGKRTFPFVKQECVFVPGNFFGQSIIERLIPVQRAYNAVKNRKHEFMNRLSTGILKVEDGSIDIDDLSDEGLTPGKVIVYRQGAKSPEIMEETALPPDFGQEEEKLLEEFESVSGISNVSTSTRNARLSSASALEILINQENERVIPNAENVRRAYLEISRQVLRLYSQFITGLKAIKYKDEFDNVKICYADKNSARSDDVYLNTENEMLFSPTQRKNMVMSLYESGILEDEKGKLRPSVKDKILTLLGYKELNYQSGISGMHEQKAKAENEKIKESGLSIEEIDDDAIHIDEHTRYVLSEYGELSDKEKQRLFAHIKAHRERLNQNKQN